MSYTHLLFQSQAMAQTETAAVPAASTTAAAAQPPGWMQFVPFAVILIVFYFFLIRPQAKKQKEQQNFLTSLKVGDQVITTSGILGRIAGINENIINLEVAQSTQVKMLRSQVMALQSSLQTQSNK